METADMARFRRRRGTLRRRLRGWREGVAVMPIGDLLAGVAARRLRRERGGNRVLSSWRSQFAHLERRAGVLARSWRQLSPATIGALSQCGKVGTISQCRRWWCWRLVQFRIAEPGRIRPPATAWRISSPRRSYRDPDERADLQVRPRAARATRRCTDGAAPIRAARRLRDHVVRALCDPVAAADPEGVRRLLSVPGDRARGDERIRPGPQHREVPHDAGAARSSCLVAQVRGCVEHQHRPAAVPGVRDDRRSTFRTRTRETFDHRGAELARGERHRQRAARQESSRPTRCSRRACRHSAAMAPRPSPAQPRPTSWASCSRWSLRVRRRRSTRSSRCCPRWAPEVQQRPRRTGLDHGDPDRRKCSQAGADLGVEPARIPIRCPR